LISAPRAGGAGGKIEDGEIAGGAAGFGAGAVQPANVKRAAPIARIREFMTGRSIRRIGEPCGAALARLARIALILLCGGRG
jgi:hypothetical protein